MARVLISMKDGFLRRIDEVAEREQRSRSELIREALRFYIRRSTAVNTTRSEQDAKLIESILD